MFSQKDGLQTTPLEEGEVDLAVLLSTVAADLALALGLVRVLTLLPLYDSSLDELEQQLAVCLEEAQQARAVLRDLSNLSRAMREAHA